MCFWDPQARHKEGAKLLQAFAPFLRLQEFPEELSFALLCLPPGQLVYHKDVQWLLFSEYPRLYEIPMLDLEQPWETPFPLKTWRPVQRTGNRRVRPELKVRPLLLRVSSFCKWVRWLPSENPCSAIESHKRNMLWGQDGRLSLPVQTQPSGREEG